MPERNITPTDFFFTGGTMHHNSPSYVFRPADDELFNQVLAGQFCYVLTPRQMGKSSLVVRTAQRLKKEGIKTVDIDLQGVGGKDIIVDQWYQTLLDVIQEKLSLPVSPEAWWQEHTSLSPVRRFITYLRDVVLVEVKDQVVIFIDEIDITFHLDFRDDFFAAIRAMYNARATDSTCKRLTFVLLGVVSPSDLIKDPTISPFNIGQRIDLHEFDLSDASVLQEGLETFHPRRGENIFTRIYNWTNGHPYLTQKLCLAAADTKNGLWTEKQVDELVKQLFLSAEINEEDHLELVEKQILDNDRRRDLLKLYEQVYQGKAVSDDKQSYLQNQLKLSGLVKAEKRYLRVRNEIYRNVFNLNWIQENTQRDWNRILVSVAAVLLAVLLGILGSIFWYNTFRVPDLADKAELDFHRAHNSPEKQLIALATLFEEQGFGGTPNYDDKARELFFESLAEEQLALFKVKNEKIIIVIKGLYTTLADVDNTNSSGLLLKEMVNILEKLDKPEKTNTLLAEIRSWEQGRTLAKQRQYDSALTKYNQAVTLNNENLATSYERARVLAQLGRYEAALNDLDRIIGGVRQISDVTPTPQLTNTVTPPIHTPTISDLTSISVTVTSLPIPAETPSPTSMSLPAPFSSEFVNTGQMISAVRDLINNNSNLANYLREFPDSYSNLQNFELVPPPFDEINVVISEITNPGKSSWEVLVILNNGIGTSLKNWKLEGSPFGDFIFPDIFLFSGGSIRIHTAAGENTAIDFYLNQSESAWPPGTTIILSNADNLEITRFTVPEYQFTPTGFYADKNEDLVYFNGAIRDEAGNPVNGFSVLLDNGTFGVLSHPSGPSNHYPDKEDGEWDVAIPNVEDGIGQWTLTVVSYDCPDFAVVFDTQCKQYTRLSADILVEVTYPEETIINANWVCHWDCDKGVLP